ncbi:MAG: hypothetical protein NTV42_07690 [Chloroflexi bacterium]|nr:hypothetical protein [Chloroflexota bacterium]
MSSCSRHASKEAVGTCINCGKLVCEACRKDIDGKSYCPVCLEKFFTAAQVKSDQASSTVPSATELAPLPVEKDKIEAAPVVQAEKAVEPATLPGKPRPAPEKKGIVQPGASQPVSNLWWLLPVFLAWVGGLAAWLATRDKEAKKARNMLFTGLGMTVIQGVIVFVLIFTLLGPAFKGVISTITSPPVNGTGQTTTSDGVKNWNSGKISTGQTVQLASTNIEAAGGSIKVEKSGEELNGLEISVPEGAYSDSRPFSISYAPITGNTFPGFHPISPLIKIDNGGGLANKMMAVKIPVKVPEGNSVAAFYIDEKTNSLQAMQTLALDQDSITVGAMHFSEIGVGTQPPALKPIETQFQPGLDDWPIPNSCSYLTPAGECGGLCISALWYYWKVFLPLQGQEERVPHLHNLLDNNGNKPPTPGFWQDDSLSYRFVCAVQENFQPGLYMGDIYRNQPTDDGTVWSNLAAAMGSEHEPQLLLLDKTGTSDATYGHAVIAYGLQQIDANNGMVNIADPSYHGEKDRVIRYVNGRFQPYRSCPTSDDCGDTYKLDKVLFAEKNMSLRWAGVEDLWPQVMDGTIGNKPVGPNRQKFPEYSLTILDSKGNKQPLAESLKAEDKLFSIVVESPDGAQLFADVFRDQQQESANADKQYELKPGKNHLGILIQGNLDGYPRYVDFQYVDIFYGEATVKIISPARFPRRMKSRLPVMTCSSASRILISK